MDSGDKNRWSSTGRWGGWRTRGEGLDSYVPCYSRSAEKENGQAGSEGS